MDTIILFSGGLDSLVAAGLLMEDKPSDVLAGVFFDYGQHTTGVEWEAAVSLSEHLPSERFALVRRSIRDYHEYVKDISIVKGNVAKADEDPSLFFVPGRNIVFLLYASIIGYAHGCRRIAFSAHKSDRVSGDCQPEFITSFENTLGWGMGLHGKQAPYKVWSPLIGMTKGDVVREGTRLGLPLHLSWSCYDVGDKHCGVCHNCVERREAFKTERIPDPTEYMV